MTVKRPSRAVGDADRAEGPGVSDAPTDSDHRRIRKARRQARTRYAAIEAARAVEAAAAFRAELGVIVRSASSLLISLLAIDGLTLDVAVTLIEPGRPWPRQPRLAGRSFGHRVSNHLLRYYIAGTPAGRSAEPPVSQHTFYREDGDYLTMKVVAHSLELEARIAPLWLETRFGELRVQLDEALPETIAIACVGRLIEEVVDHHAWRGRGWRIVDVEDAVAPYFGQTLIVTAGSAPYCITWPQPAGPGNR